MAREFKHIEVDDGDELVIYAGTARQGCDAPGTACADAFGGARAPKPKDATHDEGRGSQAQAALESAPSHPADAALQTGDASGGKAEYRETSLEDIESSKMPKAQIAVIAVALAGLIGAAVYIFLGL